MPESKNSASVGAFLWAVKDHWIALMSGGIITVLLGVFERFTGKNVPLWVYASVLIFFAFLACYLAWRDARNKLAEAISGSGKFEREYLADRLKSLLRNAEESTLNDRFMAPGFIPINHYQAIREFLGRHYDEETVKRFDNQGISVVERLIAECYSGDTQLTKRNTNNA